MSKIFVRPAPGLLVRRENAAGYIDAQGEDVLRTTYYRRRLGDGDLVAAERPEAGDAELAEAITIVLGRPDDCTADGRPKTEALAAILGRPVTAADRDRVWTARQSQSGE